MPINKTEFSKQRIYQVDTNVGLIFQDLNQLAEIDKWAEKQQNKFTTILVVAIVIFIGSFFLTTIYPPVGAVLLVLSFAGVIFASINVTYYSSLNVEDLRYQLPKKVLSMLNRDRDGQKNVKITIDFNNPTKKEKKINEMPHPYRNGWKLQIFEDNWLLLSGSFLDGNMFSLNITEINQISSGWKRGRSGKMKHKSKTKFKACEIGLTIKYRAKKYGSVKLLEKDANEAVKLPQFVRNKGVTINDKYVSLNVKLATKELNDLYEVITAMFLSLYQILNLGQILSKSAVADQN
jgi:hypothetical protein